MLLECSYLELWFLVTISSRGGLVLATVQVALGNHTFTTESADVHNISRYSRVDKKQILQLVVVAS